jgi:hypothetical protein
MQNDPYFGHLYAACHYYFTKASVFTGGGFAIRQSRNPRQTKSGERIQGPDIVAAFAHTSRGYTWSGTHLHQARP